MNTCKKKMLSSQSTTNPLDIIFGTLQSAPQAVYMGPPPTEAPTEVMKRAEKETAMYDCCEETYDAAKERLLCRTEIVQSKTQEKLRVKFGFGQDPAPNEGTELVARIQSGKYILPQKEEGWAGSLFGIIWRDPAIKQDEAGLKAATQTLKDAATNAKDEIYVLEPKDGLAAFRAFEATANGLVN